MDQAGPKIGHGVYTLPDAALILRIPLTKMHRWVNGYLRDAERVLPLGEISTWGTGRERVFNFLTLIELFTVANFRELGVSMKTIRTSRRELGEHLNSIHPFAHHGLVSDGRKILLELDHVAPDAYLELGAQGQTAFKDVMEQFCSKLEFDRSSLLAERFWPNGKSSSIVVDPHQGFGRPTVAGTNITTETLDHLLLAGEAAEDIAIMYDLAVEQVIDAKNFEHGLIAA